MTILWGCYLAGLGDNWIPIEFAYIEQYLTEIPEILNKSTIIKQVWSSQTVDNLKNIYGACPKAKVNVVFSNEYRSLSCVRQNANIA